MPLSEYDVRSIAAGTRIALEEAEVAQLTVDLNTIIANLEPIRQYDLTGVEPTYYPIPGLHNIMRDDVILPGLSHAEAMALAPVSEAGQYKIPSILGEGGN